jgi:hypothetical protein
MAARQLKWLFAGFPPRRSGFGPGSGKVGFVEDKVALVQVFSEYFGFHCPSLIHKSLHPHNHLGHVQQARNGRRAEMTQFGLYPQLSELKKKQLIYIFVIINM